MHTIFPNWPTQSPQFINDPYPFYRMRREINPIGQTRAGPWCLTGYDVVQKALLHPDVGAQITSSGFVTQDSDMLRLGQRWVVFRNPPEHSRLRRLVGQSFYHLVKNDGKTIIADILKKLLNKIGDKKEIDFVEEFSFPMPLQVIMTLIGIPAADWPAVTEWVKPLAVLINPFADLGYSYEETENAASSLLSYLISLVEKKRLEPGHDVISNLLKSDKNGDQLSNEDLVSNVAFFLFAGHETTVNQLGNSLFALLNERHLWENIIQAPDIIPRAVEELLRYDSPVQLTIKQALKDLEISGCQIAAGDELRLFIGAANRDPQHFENAEKIILDRPRIPNLVFGKGDHACMGASLSRLEGKMAFEALSENFPNMRLVQSNYERKSGLNLRGFQSLKIHLG